MMHGKLYIKASVIQYTAKKIISFTAAVKAKLGIEHFETQHFH